MDFFAVKVDGSDVIVGTSECFNIQTRHKFENCDLYSSTSACFHYVNTVHIMKQVHGMTSLPSTLTAKTESNL